MSVTTGVKGVNKLLAIADTLNIGAIADGEVLTRSGQNIVSTALTSTTNTSFRETHGGFGLIAGNPNPSYLEKWVTFNTPFDYVQDVDGRFTFDGQFVQINEDGVYRYDITISTTGNSSGRSEQFFLTNDTFPIDETNVQYVIASATTVQLEYGPTWQGDSTVQSANMSGTCNITGSPIKLRVAYIVQADVQINRELTTWSMQYIPPDVNTGPQGPQGIPGVPGTPGGVTAVTTTAPISLGGTVANPIIGHANSGVTAQTYVSPFNLVLNAAGHATSCSSAAQPFFSIANGGSDISMATGGVAGSRSFSVSHQNSGVAAGTTLFPASITHNLRGHITAITAGTQPLLATQLAQPNGVASLNSLGKIPNAQIPPLAITSTFQVPTLADLTTLTAAEEGDVGIVTSDIVVANNGAYILSTNDPTVLANWIAIESPGGGVATIAVTAPITNTGSAINPVIGHALSGTPVGVFTNATVETNATGHIINISNGAAIPPSFQPLYRSMKSRDANNGIPYQFATGANNAFFTAIQALPSQSKGASFGIWSTVGGFPNTTTRLTFATEGYYRCSYKIPLTVFSTPTEVTSVNVVIFKDSVIVDVNNTYYDVDAGAGSSEQGLTTYGEYVDFFTVNQTVDFAVTPVTAPALYPARTLTNANSAWILIERLADQ